ncbi:Sarcolemmal membrane-associated protein [Eumeta japonica]|uniref:Sarcolemmal membrane-associated protein n=1 Tax=Eumeta variegata TaxID=151549 RepID=A0A4C1V2N8_EUMVA|nr:Sarcolemmal membrane-associated protein [Eumeta japonica]
MKLGKWIGRNVYHATPSPNNTIFECRVLSRHHATLYYDKGNFYLVDNQSSNGTFINNSQCSISKNKEPHQVFSGDVVQFGISVVDNAGSAEKTTFPPVVALLKLYHPDGSEAKLSFNPTMTAPLHLRELYQLNTFMQEALQREASLENRLRTLRECVERTRGEANAAWQLFVGEQQLLMRVHTLETALAAGRQPDQGQLQQLLEDKKNYQEVAQESLRTAHEQRLALEEILDRRSCEAAALHTHNCALRLAANNALAELQKLATRCERKMSAARSAITAAEEREAAARAKLPLAVNYSRGRTGQEGVSKDLVGLEVDAQGSVLLKLLALNMDSFQRQDHSLCLYSVVNGEAKLLVVSTDSNRVAEERRGPHSLEDAIRALPDYVKLLLPQHILAKVGIKVVSASDTKSLKKNISEKRGSTRGKKSEKQSGSPDDDSGGGEGGGGEKAIEETSTDDEKHARANHDITLETEESTPADAPLRPDNNANSTYGDLDDGDDSGVGQLEYANVLRVMSGLNEEIRVLRERLIAANADVEQLRAVRDELLAAGAERDEPTPPDVDDAAVMRARIVELQAQLSRSSVAEEANLAEIQRLTTSAAEMEAELAYRPTRAHVDELAATVRRLHDDLHERDMQLARLRASPPPVPTCDRSTETDSWPLPIDAHHPPAAISVSQETVPADADVDVPHHKDIAEEIDEMFKLDYEDEDDETDSPDTEVLDDRHVTLNGSTIDGCALDDSVILVSSALDHSETGLDTTAVSGHYVRLDDEERLQVTLHNGSLHALEEELVRTKERWAEVNADRARLAAQLATLQVTLNESGGVGTGAQGTAGRGPVPTWVSVALPVLLALAVWLALPYLS